MIGEEKRKRPQVVRRLDRKNFSTERVEQALEGSGEPPSLEGFNTCVTVALKDVV